MSGIFEAKYKFIIRRTVNYFHLLGPLGQVGHRVAMSVCMCVCHKSCNCQLWQNGQSFFSFFSSSHKIEWVCMVVRIINLEGHQNSMIGSKVTTILTMFFFHD